MDHYLELRLLPDPEFTATVLLSALFAKLHRALVELPDAGLGISFPGYDTTGPGLGDRLRIHGSAAALSQLHQRPWLTGMRDHLAPADPHPTPPSNHTVLVRRVQTRSSPERQRRRLVTRFGLTAEQARARRPEQHGKRLDLPWVEVSSTSTSQRFRLFIDQQPRPGPIVPGPFSPYGLSSIATVPWF